jgi:hypothetical protein
MRESSRVRGLFFGPRATVVNHELGGCVRGGLEAIPTNEDDDDECEKLGDRLVEVVDSHLSGRPAVQRGPAV